MENFLSLKPNAPEGSQERRYFEAAIVSWGNLGIIYSATLQCCPGNFNTIVNRRPLEYKQVIGNVEKLMRENDSVLLGISPKSEVIFVKTQTPIQKSVSAISSRSDFFDFMVECRVFAIFYGNFTKKPWKYLLGVIFNILVGHAKILQIMDWDEGEYVVKAWKDRAFLNIEYCCPIKNIDAAIAIIIKTFDDARKKGIHDHATPMFFRNCKADTEG